ncbi:MAG: signal peptidase II [Verrucomicrobiales bacterium]|jgi:signal peptidase II
MKYILYLTLPLYVLDQITKALVVKYIEQDFGRIEVTSFFNLTHIRNEGVAFGMANGSPWANVVFGMVSLTALIAIPVLWRRGAFPGRLAKFAAALLMSGILGNLTDRIYRGSVVDFLDFHWAGKHFANFNVADSCICIAASLIFISAFLPEPQEETEVADGG